MLIFIKAVTTTETTLLETAADIVDYVHAELVRRADAAPFRSPATACASPVATASHPTSWLVTSAR